MKLINNYQQDKIRLRYEIVASAVLASFMVSATAFLTSPLAYGMLQNGLV